MKVLPTKEPIYDHVLALLHNMFSVESGFPGRKCQGSLVVSLFNADSSVHC